VLSAAIYSVSLEFRECGWTDTTWREEGVSEIICDASCVKGSVLRPAKSNDF
jgi:hypothetical protein